jgi:DNA-binding Lrp family transcriptional regulator
MDEKDKKILKLLKENAKLTTYQIFKRTGIPPTTVHNRIKKMEKDGVIKNYTVVLDHKKIGKPILAFVAVNVVYTLPGGKKIRQEDVAQKIKSMEGVDEVVIVAGVTDMLVKVRVKDIDELNDFVIRKLRSIDGVDKTETMVALSAL